MNIIEHFEGESQDRRIELIAKILEFREELFKDGKKSKELANMASVIVFSLVGAAHGYKPCCILHFCVNAYFGIKEPLSISSGDGRVMCPNCIADEVTF